MLANGKAIAWRRPGLIKTVFDAKTGEILGAHMVGPEVTELIQGYAIARTLEATEAELMQTIFPHPTLSEAMHSRSLTHMVAPSTSRGERGPAMLSAHNEPNEPLSRPCHIELTKGAERHPEKP